VLDVVGLLQSERDSLTRSEQTLADFVLSDVDAVLRMSIVELAKVALVSAPTVTRFCRRLGCESYADFKVRLAQSRFIGQRYIAPISGPKSANEIAQGVINGIQATLYDSFAKLDFDAIEKAAEAIANASFVLTVGSGGSSSMMATETEARLFRLGLKVSSSTDHQVQLMRAAGAPTGSAMIAFSLTGNNMPLVDAVSAAGEYGITRIVVTQPGSALAEQGDVVIPIYWQENQDILRPTPSRYVFLAVIDILAQTVATKLGVSAVATMRRIKHQLVLTRDGDDAQPLGD
jgi:DNA-binding MurR/RpiR family transcriptional regulator